MWKCAIKQVIPHCFQVLEFMESDLEAVIKDRSLVLAPADIKCFMQQLLAGLQACHSRWVIHRDVKARLKLQDLYYVCRVSGQV